MPVAEQQQKPQMSPKAALTANDAATIAKLTQREKWLEFTVDDILLAWDQFPDGTASMRLAHELLVGDFKRFIRLASAKGLDPLLNQLHFEYRSDSKSVTGMKGTTVIHQNGDLVIAHRTGLLDGITQEDAKDERGFYVRTIIHKQGCAHPFTFKAYLEEFSQSSPVWGKSPFNMIAKCSRAGCLRIAFPEQLGGMVTEDEMDYEDRGRQQQPTAPPQGITVGEIQKPADKPASAPAPEQPKQQTQVEQPKADPSKTEPPQQDTTPDPDPTGQYKARLKLLVGTESAYAKAGLNKGHIDQFMLGYFGVDSKAKMPTDPAAYLEMFDDLILRLGQYVGEVETLKNGSRGYGVLRREAVNAKPKPGPFAAELSKRFGWDLALCSLAAKVMTKVGFTTVDDFKNDVLDASGLSQMTQPQILIGMWFCYYGPEPLGLALQANKKGTPMTQLLAETEKYVGSPLDSLTCDPAKVLEGTKAAITAMEKK